MPAPAPVEALLFDLGGVLIEIDFQRALQLWAPMSSLPFGALKEAFRFDPAYEKHERGEIDRDAYFAHLREALALRGGDEEIEAAWNSIFIREIPGALDALRRARTRLPCYAFTNTNPTHRKAWAGAHPQVATAFDRVFASCDMGLRKPERAAFEAIANAIGVAPRNILFFDDTLENVVGAKEAGLQAVHITPVDGLAVALARAGMIS